MKDLSGKTVIVVGASRGLGRGIALAFREAGANVVAVARTETDFPTPTGNAGTIRTERADAGEAAVAAGLLRKHRPDIVVLVAGATPHMAPLQQQTWESFSVNWQADVRLAFHWLREILLNPLKSGSRVVVISSGAALAGSPISGGYAGAKATQRFVAAYAQDEAKRAGLGITFTTILPRFSPQTGIGGPAVDAYAARAGQSRDDYLRSIVQSGGPLVTPEIAGAALVGLVAEDAANISPAYLLSGDGLKKLS
ncbi:MAG TPA: SDR family oxidoreductase [Steroidobacteraceae bacterium]|nr:SDR family oxidoreductase [Steroidobacteraceae bacterium]